MQRKPDLTFKPSELSRLRAIWVYIWKRDKQALYIGRTTQGMMRLLGHNVIGRIEEVQPDDRFEAFICASWEEAQELETRLINELAPKHNIAYRFDPTGQEIECLTCGRRFVRTRWWQRYCSARCRVGDNPFGASPETRP